VHEEAGADVDNVYMPTYVHCVNISREFHQNNQPSGGFVTSFASYLVVWGDDARALPAPSQVHVLAEAALAHDGELLALGPTLDSSEQESRSVPAWLALARFASESRASEWFTETGGQLKGTTLVVPALSEPPWWPGDRESQRPGWSRDLDPPRERLELFNCVWSEITDPATFSDYSRHFMWTVENDGGAFLAKGPAPRVLAGGPGPHGSAIMGWPGDGAARQAWYVGADYLPYKLQRHASSKSTTARVAALGKRARHV
jgi:uncharacterized protein (DUF1330 family)